MSDFICKHKKLIILITLLLLIPTFIGIKKTKINYDILVYLPEDIETMKGQQILTDDFNMGAFSISIIDNMNAKDVIKVEEKIKKIDGVNNVMSLYDAIGTTIPIEMLPDSVTSNLYKDNKTLLFITFRDGTSNENTLKAVEEIRTLSDKLEVGGMSAMVLDTMNLSNQEILIYVVIAVALCLIVLMFSLNSYFISILLLGNIGISILFNMGTNIFLGNISYITKAISTILQLGVTTDFSIFLYHKFEAAKKEEKNINIAMSKAIKDTMVSVCGSSLTTIAGFLALCTMTLTLGKDIGIVMAKGVVFGVICVLTLFPSLILCFDKIIDKTKHKNFLPEFKTLKKISIKYYKIIFALFLILLIPAYYGQDNTKIYYNLDKTLPSTLPSSIANDELKEKFNIVSPEVVLINTNISNNKINEMINDIEKLDGVEFAASFSSLGISENMLDENLTKMFKNDDYQMILINSTYGIATDELNDQLGKIDKIVKKVDKKAIIAGEGPLMKDLTITANKDFKSVTIASLAVIFVLMLLVLKSISLPFILIATIEFAIFINMGIPFYTNTTLPFIASIVIGTIQLGATIDYAILMTTKYLEERKTKDKEEALKSTLDKTVSSIIVSGMCFFAATAGVGIYSKLELISSLCTLISRGAIISMLVVILVLPSMLLIFDKLIMKTTKGGKLCLKKD